MTPKSPSRRLNIAMLAIAIGSICCALWLTPGSARESDQERSPSEADAAAPDLQGTPASPSDTAAPTAGTAGEPGDDQSHAADASDGPSRTIGTIAVPISATGSGEVPPSATSPHASTPTDPSGTDNETAGSQSGHGHGQGHQGSGGGQSKIEGCWSFKYQQDAQAVYRRNISDPYGLDGAKGPFNGDGLACTQLPVDPDRKASTPVGAYVPPEPQIPIKAELVRPATTKYFGVAEDGLPGDTTLMDKLSTQVGKAPSMVEWFATWDEPYRPAKVQASWARGALPVITWMPAHKGNQNPSDISLQKIVDGEWDDYILRYAGDVAREGKPIVLRFAHEANGNWYPWSAGGNRRFERGDNGEEPFFNTPALYREAWRHVWTLFDQVGANSDVIWAYTPVRSNTIQPNLTDLSLSTYGMTSIADGYPGDAYVDWVGMSAYAYSGTGWSFSSTFSRTLTEYEAIAPDKPILVAETGASETTGSVSNRDRKAFWITDSLAGMALHPQIVGFVWFNNTVVNVHTANGELITTDNKWDTSPESLTAFTDAIADPVWATGLAPDTVNATATRHTSPGGTR